MQTTSSRSRAPRPGRSRPTSTAILSNLTMVVVMAAGATLGLSLGGAQRAWAQNPEALAKVKDLNKKAVDSYENLDLEEARKSLMTALELCASEGLNRHPLKATTHLNLGVVLMGGLKEKDAAIKQFRRALEIDPTIKVPRRLSNPEIQGAFDAAVKEAAGGEPVAGAEKPATPTAPPETGGEPKPTPAAASAVIHDPISEAKPGQAIPIRAKVDSALRFDSLVLAYRPEGASDFLARAMERDASGEYAARIPDVATAGGSVAYYIEARGRGGQALARNGTPDEPHVVTLSAGGAVAVAAQADTGEEPAGESKPRTSGDPTGHFWLGFGVGMGGGWVKGSPEVNRNYLDPGTGNALPIDVNTFAAAKLMHFLPEVGYYASPHLSLSLQARMQLTTGATEVHHPSCTPSMICKPATGAIGVLARATWLFGDGDTFHPFVSFAAGGGYIRYLVDLGNIPLTGCGTDGTQTKCFDTVAGGGLLLGPGAGIWFALARSLYVTGTVSTLLGVPATAFNIDLNLGLAYRL